MVKRIINLRVVMIMMLAMFCSLQGFAGGGTTNRTYYSKATAIAPSGKGTVYVSKTNSDAGATYAEESFATNSSSASSAPKHTYYMFAKAAEGLSFAGWSTTEGGSVTSTANPYTCQVTANSTTQGSPTENTLYAIFAESQTFYSTITVNATEGGKVFVATAETANPEYAATATASQNTEGAGSASHNYNLYAQAEDGYEFKGWMKEGSDAVVSTANPYTVTVSTESVDAENPTAVTYVPKFVTAVPHYSKVIAKLAGNNDISNLGTAMIGGKVYVGKTDSDTPEFAYTSEATQMTYSVDDASHEYYLYAEAEEGYEFAGWGTSAGVLTNFNNTDNPYKSSALKVTSTDETNPTEKIYYAAFKYKADNKPTTAYANFTVVTNVVVTDENNKQSAVEDVNAAQVGIVYGENLTTCDDWHQGSYTSETYSLPYTSGGTKFPFTVFVKPAPGYEFLGWATSASTVAPTSSNKGTTVDDYNYYFGSNSTNSISSNNYPGQCGIENGPKNKKMYAVFKKLEMMDEPFGDTPVEVTDVTGTTELVEGSENKNFSVDLVLNENLPYDKPGSDKNPKPNDALTQFVTVQGANGNKSEVASFSLAYESTDLGEGGTNGDGSLGTLYSCHTIRLFFPYNIKADTYTVHLPYGLYTTVDGNKTPTYEFTITVTEDTNPYLTIKSQFPTEGLTMKYKAATQTSEPDNSKGEFEKSNITATVTFNEVVESIDESKKDGIVLVNTTEGVNYKSLSVIRNAALYGKVSGEVSISYPELVNGSYTLTIPEGLFVGNGKVNEAITVNFTVTGFNNVQLKPYEMVTDQITPKANAMAEKIEKLQDITISYKGENGNAVALVGDASGIKIQRYTEVINGEGESAKPVRTYYDVETTPSVKVQDGKLVVTFSPALFSGMYEVTVPAGIAANMEPGNMTMGQKVNAGYAETPALSAVTYNVESEVIEVALEVKAASKYGTLIVPFDAELPEGIKAYTCEASEGSHLVLTEADGIQGNVAYIIENTTGEDITALKLSGAQAYEMTGSYTTGLLTGVYTKTAAPVDSYILQTNNGVTGFYHVANKGLYVGANHAFLRLYDHETPEVKAFYFDEATALDVVEALASGKAEIYNLNGQKVNSLQKGVNIVNGKKVLVK